MPYLLQAGPVQVRYETGFLRYLTVDEVEVLRMIYVAIRDHNWLTATLTFQDERITQTPDSFQIRYDWQIDDLGIRMAGQVMIQGDSDGTIAVDFYGKALSEFRKNRIGLCVLHPIEGILGQPAEIIEPDGKLTMGHFPTLISPYQPFLNIQQLRWQAASWAVLQLEFGGDVFETEDQRNWTDASFKTYSTPLVRPFPVPVSIGDEFRQRVVFRLATTAFVPQTPTGEATVAPSSLETVAVTQKPLVGVGQRADGKSMTVAEADQLRQLKLAHIRTDVFFSFPGWRARLICAIADANLLALPLELALFFGNDAVAEWQMLQTFLRTTTVPIRSILLFDAATLLTTNALLQTIGPRVRTEWPDGLIGGGSDNDFVGLNRHPFAFELVDFVTYSLNPQVHAFDDLTLLENIAGQADTVLSAKALSGGKPVHISPVTLRPRFTTLAETATERQSTDADPRHATDFGAEWTRLSLNALAEAGAASVTYCQSHGPAGLVDGETSFPVYDVFK